MEKLSFLKRNSSSATYGGTSSQQQQDSSLSTSALGGEDKCAKCQNCQIREVQIGEAPTQPMDQSSQNSSHLINMPTNQAGNYNVLCSCSDSRLQECQCQQNHNRLTSKWNPQNWPHWPLIKKVLIYSAIAVLLIWLLFYLILHFYLERQNK